LEGNQGKSRGLRRVQFKCRDVVLPELSSAHLSHGFGSLGSQAELSSNNPEAASDSQL